MFEKEISGYAFNITKRYTGESVPLSSLLTDVELPDSFKKFAEAEAEEMIDKEELGESKTGRFDLSIPDVQALFKEIRHVLKNSYSFSREEFLELADKASKFIFNYVIRPRWTLEKFLFKGDSEVGKADVNIAARYFSDYSYYPKGIIEYLDFHNKEMLDVETWKKLHAKIDEHLLGVLPAKASSLTSALFKLFEFSTGADKVPTDAMILFFRDKSAAEIVDRIEFAKELKNIQSLDVATLAIILEAPSKDVSQNISVLQTPEEPPKEFRTFERQTVTNPMQPQEPVALKEPEAEKETPAQEQVTEAKPGEPPPSTGQNQPSEPVQKTSSPSIRTFMSAKLEAKIIKKIFRGSRSGYQIAVHKLNESSDWKSASKVVEGIFIENEIDPFSKYAVAFTDVVSAKFRGRQ